VAADLALRKSIPVQDVPVKELQARLTQAGIPLRASYRPGMEIVNPPAEVALNQPVKFKARVLEGKAPLKYFWNFDGSGTVQSTEAEPTHTFTVSKPQVVSVKVVDADGMPSMVAETLVQVGDDKTPDPSATVKNARFEGRWDRGGSLAVQNRHRVNYHDLNEGKGEKSVTFTTKLPRAGRYLVALAFQGGPDRSTKTPVTVTSADGDKELMVNQSTGADPFAFTPLGEFAFKEGAQGKVTVRNDGTDGFVSADAVRWIWLGP
jgi:PKD repeat protein